MPSRVLVVDDDPDIRETLADVLTDEGFEVVVVADGMLALAEIDRQIPDVVLLDLMMPVLDGWKTFEILRSTPKHASLPVIVLSAAIPPAACEHHLQKPIALDRLLKLLDVVRSQPRLAPI